MLFRSVSQSRYKWPLNRTNLRTLTRDFGKESDDWVGEFVKVKVHDWPSGARGLVVISREELRKLKVEIPEKDKGDVGDSPPSSSSSPELEDPFSLSPGEYVNTLVNRFTEADTVITKNVLFNQARDELLSVDAEFLALVAKEIDRRDYS